MPNTFCYAQHSTKLQRRQQHQQLYPQCIQSTYGLEICQWIVQQSSAYDVSDAGCYLSSCRYKVYIQSESKKGKYAGTKFDSSEAEITFTPTGDDVEPPFLVLPEPWYMKLILTKKERLAEEQLQGIEKEHVVY